MSGPTKEEINTAIAVIGWLLHVTRAQEPSAKDVVHAAEITMSRLEDAA